MNPNNLTHLEVERIRHPLKFRTLRVLRTRLLAPDFLSVVFTGHDLDDFVSASFDDHVKLFFPDAGQHQIAPPNPDGGAMPTGIRRDFTPRRFDREKRELEIQFAVHGTGPASEWAAKARVGDTLGIGGPRGSRVIPPGFDWFLLAGDATAFPAMARCLEELPPGKRVTVIAATHGPQARIEFPCAESGSSVSVIWADLQADPLALERAVAAFVLPAGEGYVWAAGEAAAMRAIHADLTGKRRFPKSRVRAAAYWKQGSADAHEEIGE